MGQNAFIKDTPQEIFHNRFNCSSSSLTFSKLLFWPLEKKPQNHPLSFAHVAVLALKANFDSVYTDVVP